MYIPDMSYILGLKCDLYHGHFVYCTLPSLTVIMNDEFQEYADTVYGHKCLIESINLSY